MRPAFFLYGPGVSPGGIPVALRWNVSRGSRLKQAQYSRYSVQWKTLRFMILKWKNKNQKKILTYLFNYSHYRDSDSYRNIRKLRKSLGQCKCEIFCVCFFSKSFDELPLVNTLFANIDYLLHNKAMHDRLFSGHLN